ncbi:MAG: LamG-like jellyroll fold domain-containing protein [Bacteroidota bacterium]|jgi:hypothetical protein
MKCETFADSFKKTTSIRKTKSLLFTAVATLGLVVATMAQNVPSYVPTNGLVGWWPFNGNANDESGNGNNGTVNGATLTTDRFGNSNTAYSFDGINDYINFNSNSTFNLVNDITISCWSQSLNSSSNQAQLVWFGDAQPAKDPYSIAISSSNLFYFRKDVSTGSTILQLNSTTSLNTNYFHIIGTYNVSANKMKIYINGLLQDSINVNFSTNYATQNMFLNFASANNGTEQFFKGNLDDIGIWNRALTQQEITNLYNGNICYQYITVTDTLLINMGINGFNPITYQNTIKIWPNPSNDHIYIDNGNFSTLSGYQIKISNSLGQQVFQSAINQQQFYVDMSTWGGAGIYFVNIINQNGVTIDTRKIVLQ